MKKLAVFSGFLGSGKTTTMIALTKYYTDKHGKAAMISNDLGYGVSLADNKLAQLSGCNASQISDDCICYVNEKLAGVLDSYYDDGYELVLSDIPGFGVGALEHVYHGLTEKYPGSFELAPFTVLVEPRTVDLLKKGKSGDLRYIYHTQLSEADLIVLNKCDLINEDEKNADLAWLGENYPLAQATAISALTGDGLEDLALALRDGKASMRKPDIGYGGEDFLFAMSKMSEFYFQYIATVCCGTFDGTAYLRDLAEKVRSEILKEGYEIPHLKLLAWEPEGDYGKVDLIGTDRDILTVHSFEKPCTSVAAVLNASAACPADLLEKIITKAAAEVSAKYQLELSVFKKEALAMG